MTVAGATHLASIPQRQLKLIVRATILFYNTKAAYLSNQNIYSTTLSMDCALWIPPTDYEESPQRFSTCSWLVVSVCYIIQYLPIDCGRALARVPAVCSEDNEQYR